MDLKGGLALNLKDLQVIEVSLPITARCACQCGVLVGAGGGGV